MSNSRAEQHDPTARFAPIFAAFGDPTRLALIGTLADGRARSVTQLTEGSRLTRQAISKHLRVLAEAGLVRSVRSGRESLYAFQPEPVAALRSYLDQVSESWDQALGRLKRLVEETP